MRAVIQRVTEASVTVDQQTVGQIGPGLLVLIGVGAEDNSSDAQTLADKIAGLRIFDDPEGKMNLAVNDIGGAVLAVSQFTLFGDARKGRRPGFSAAAAPEIARPLFDEVVAALRRSGVPTETGQFQADMAVALTNDGPVTILVDTQKLF